MIKIYIGQEPHMMQTNLWIMKEYPDGRRIYANPTEFTFSEKTEGSLVEPTLKFTSIEGSEFLRGLAESLANAGYKVDLSHDRGELKATKAHLEDMRKLVFVLY